MRRNRKRRKKANLNGKRNMQNKRNTYYCLWYLYGRLNINKTLRREKQVLQQCM